MTTMLYSTANVVRDRFARCRLSVMFAVCALLAGPALAAATAPQPGAPTTPGTAGAAGPGSAAVEPAADPADATGQAAEGGAGDDADIRHATAATAADDDPAEGSEPLPETRIDAIHEASENLVQSLAAAIDDFFVSDDFATFDDNETRVRLRYNVDHLENAGWEAGPKIKVNLQLPQLSERLSLVLNDGDIDDDDEPADSDDDENDLALRWRLGGNDHTEMKFDIGVRSKGGAIDPFTRLNLGIEYPIAGEWQGRTSDRIYYYSKTGLRNDLRQYFDRRFNKKTLLRSRTRIEYLEENDHNPNIEQRFSIFNTFGSHSAIAYEVLWRKESYEESEFADEDLVIDPQDTYEQAILRVRYRRQVARPWFYVEVWPMVAWAEEREWESLLGVRFRFEVNLGGAGKRQLDE